jgi:CBS domain-containing protein
MKTSAKKAGTKPKRSASRMKVSKIMTPNVVVVSPDDTLQIAARKMQERDIGFLPVCDGERLIGTLSDRDITIRAVSAGHAPDPLRSGTLPRRRRSGALTTRMSTMPLARCRTNRCGG